MSMNCIGAVTFTSMRSSIKGSIGMPIALNHRVKGLIAHATTMLQAGLCPRKLSSCTGHFF